MFDYLCVYYLSKSSMLQTVYIYIIKSMSFKIKKILLVFCITHFILTSKKTFIFFYQVISWDYSFKIIAIVVCKL